MHEGLAAHIHRTGIQNGFDLTLSQEFTVDHAFAVPWHFIAPHGKVAMVPIFVNCFSNPLPQARRAHDLGRMIGSFSLEIGGPQIPPNERSGVPDRKWVDRIVHLLRTHGINDLIEEATSEQMTRAGNAGGELLNWIAMLGVIGDQIPISLEPQPHGHAFGVWRWE